MRHCKHHWEERTAILREVFAESERRTHVFYVCSRCLRIDELLGPPVPIEVAEDAAWPKPQRDAA